MRTAEQTKIWAAVRNAPQREVQLVSFSFSQIPGIKDGHLRFDSPMTAICGVNGSGKSSLLRAIWATINWDNIEERPEIKQRLKGFVGELELNIDGGATKLAPNQPVHPSVKVLHVDPSTSIGQLQRDVCAINELDELIESHAPISLEQEDLAVLNSILNKEYESASIYEIDDYAEEAPFPIIHVSENGVPYDIRTMSLGEISVFNVFWALHRAERNSLVLLEEPETFLSPISQGALMDYLAQVCVKKQLTLIMTTHSPQMFGRLGVEQVRFTYRGRDGVVLADDKDYDLMRESIGISSPIDRILLLEDRAARELALNALRKRSHKNLRRSELISLNGHGDLTKTCKTFPYGHSRFKLIAVYDGDVRAEVEKQKPTWPYLFLPGDQPIEIILRDVLESGAAEVANRLGRAPNELGAVLSQHRGRDYHDWFEEIARSMNVSYAELMHVCFEQWVMDPWSDAQVDNFLVDLDAIA